MIVRSGTVILRNGFAVLLLAAMFSSAAVGQSAESFFKDRQVRMVVGSETGGGYDSYARLLIKHLPRHLPGTTNFVAVTMPGVGSLIAMNHLYNLAPKDGSVIGAINPGGIAEPLLHPDNAKFDSRRFQWIGSTMRDTEVIVVAADAPIRTFEDLFSKELIVAGTGGAGSTLPLLLNGILATKFKVIQGYKGSTSGYLAMQSGEVQGLGSSSWSSIKTTQTALLEGKKIRILAQYGLSPNVDLKDVPTVMDFATTDEQKAAFRMMLTRQDIGRPYLAPPGVPAPVMAAYRKAFQDTMADPEFVSEMRARQFDLDPITAEEIARLIDGIYAAPPELVARVNRILGDRS
jgi:tripartite-type tricarboxylate transporter receptor subunit TctC